MSVAPFASRWTGYLLAGPGYSVACRALNFKAEGFPSSLHRSGLALAVRCQHLGWPLTNRASRSKAAARLGLRGGPRRRRLFGGGGRSGGGGGSGLSPNILDGNSTSYSDTDMLNSVDYPSSSSDSDPEAVAALTKRWAHCQRKWRQAWGQVMYLYYNWRQDSFSDLQLFIGFNILLLLLGGCIQGAVIRKLDGSLSELDSAAGPAWWSDLYEVMVWVLGQDLPQHAGLASQVFAVLTVTLGLASFALVLALIEQVVLEVLESNVKRGSQVYEEGHIVVLAWGRSALDLTQVTRILGQVVHASKGTGGDVVVVLTEQRDKLEMESICREVLPPCKRRGTQFVFRQGSPLDPSDLRMVAATRARAVIIAGDHSRGSVDSDAQCLRAAVLLDEMAGEQAQHGSGPSIVVQVHSPDPLGLLDYACSERVIPVPTFLINARRIARVLRHPIEGVFSHMLTDFSSSAHAAITRQTSRLVGKPFGDLHMYFPNATVLGIVSSASGACCLNPHPSRRLRPGDALLLMCSSNPSHQIPAEAPLLVEPGDWDPSSYILRSHDTEPLGVDSVGESLAAFGRSNKPSFRNSLTRRSMTEDEGSAGDESHARRIGNGTYVLPMQFSNTLAQAKNVLICGWSSDEFGWTLLEELDHGPCPLPPGANITLFHNHSWDASIGDLCEEHCLENVSVQHVKGDPRSRHAMRKLLDIASFDAVVALSDRLWADTVHLDEEGEGRSSLAQAKMLSLDASMLVVQLNIRLLLEERGLPDVNIISQRKSYIGTTRFEDTERLPIGISIVSASFSAKMLTQVAFEPQTLWLYTASWRDSDMVVQDSSSFAAEGERLSWLQLQERCSSVHQVLLGSYHIPSSGEQPLTVLVNPQGAEARMQKTVWNCGDGRHKIVTLALKETIDLAFMSSMSSGSSSSSSGSSSSSSDSGLSSINGSGGIWCSSSSSDAGLGIGGGARSSKDSGGGSRSSSSSSSSSMKGSNDFGGSSKGVRSSNGGSGGGSSSKSSSGGGGSSMGVGGSPAITRIS